MRNGGALIPWSLPISMLQYPGVRTWPETLCHRGIFSAGTAVQCGHFQPNSNEQVGTYQHCVHQSIASPCANAENAHLPSGLSTAALTVEICHWLFPGDHKTEFQTTSEPLADGVQHK